MRFAVDASLTRTDNSVHPRTRSVGSGRDQLQQGARVAADPLFGQLSYAGSVTGTSIVTRHVNPIDISVQGPRFVAMSPLLVSTPIVTRPISVVQQVATPPVSVATPPRQVVVSTSGAYVPAFISPFDGTSVVTTSYPTTPVSSFSTAVSTGYSVSASRHVSQFRLVPRSRRCLGYPQ